MISLTDKGVISYGIASQTIFPHLLNNPQTDIEGYIEEQNLGRQPAGETDAHIDAALVRHADKIAAYKKGKKGLLSVFVGEVMRLSKGKAAAEEVTKKLTEKLNG